MVTYNRIIMDLCAVCGVEVGNARISERRARELIRMCTENVRAHGVIAQEGHTVDLEEPEKETEEPEKETEEPEKPRFKAPRKAN